MAKPTKKEKSFQGKVDSTTLYAIDKAFEIVRECATAKFDESIDVAVQLGIDPRKSDQVVRGAVVLPNGTGKTKRVAVFAQGPKADEAKAAGADIVGMDDLAAQVKAGNLNFDVVIASLAPLGDGYQSVLKDGLSGRWSDRYPNEGKQSGAFSYGTYDGDPYILMNYKPSVLRDVFTLTHEAGHSMRR